MEGEISEVKRVLEENSSCDSYLEQLEAVTWPIGFDKLTHCNSLFNVVDAGWGPGTLRESSSENSPSVLFRLTTNDLLCLSTDPHCKIVSVRSQIC